MSVITLIFKEIRYRKFNFLLSLLAVIAAVGLCAAFFTTSHASQTETTRLMRDMGYNLRIVHNDTDMADFWARGYSDLTLPEDTAVWFATHENLLFTHLLATLKQRIEWQGREVILNGIATEVTPEDKKKPSMIFEIEPGTAYVGYTLAKVEGLNKGDKITIDGNSLIVASTLPETGNEEDIYLYTHLRDAQTILGLDNQINEIKALDCYCRIPGVNPLVLLREQIAEQFPDVKLFQIRPIAEARQKQRAMLEHYFAWIMPITVIACGLWIGALAMLNTRDRREEIGVLRALGYSSGKIATLFLGKAILIGLVGSIAGYFIGTWLAMQVAPTLFEATSKSVKPQTIILLVSVILAPAFAAISSFIPAMVAVSQDPADVLRQDL